MHSGYARSPADAGRETCPRRPPAAPVPENVEMRIDERPYDRELSTVVWKVTETCTMDCPYCFMFHSLDTSFRAKPKIISRASVDKVLFRLREYMEASTRRRTLVTLHGGEPLLVGKDLLAYVLTGLTAISGIDISIQTNGTLLDSEFASLLGQFPLSVGVSLDGYPEIQNKSRLRNGKPSYPAITRGIKRLLEEGSEGTFKGVLCVVDLEGDPVKTYRHFLELGAKSMEFLLPLRNHHTPAGYAPGRDDYFQWLRPIFRDYFDADDDTISIRLFDSIIDLLIGSEETMCSIRHSAVDMLTIDTDGSIQLIDDLRICGDRFVELGLNVEHHRLDDFFDSPKVHALWKAEVQLPYRCANCKYLDICGSGGHAFRYSGDGSFDRPSIYCTDTRELIAEIENQIYG